MKNKSMIRWIGLILTAALALTACTPDARSGKAPDTTEQPTSSVVPNTQTPGLVLDRHDLTSVLRWLRLSLEEEQPDRITDLITENGVTIVLKWPGGAPLHGSNNSASIVRELEKALGAGRPICLGYAPDFGSQPDKVMVIFQGLNLDWESAAGHDAAGEVGFVLARIDQEWELVFINLVDPEVHFQFLGELSECPDLSPDRDNSQTYTDPAGQFRVSIPSGWQPGDEEGSFYGADGALRVGYLPDMAFMYSVYRVCERLANSPGGPARKVVLSPLAEADACTLVPYPEMSVDLVRLVVENPAGEPEQRYFYLETDQAHLEAIAASLQLLNPPVEGEAFPYPAGPLRPEDEAFWSQTGPQPGELTVEEYAVAEASTASPTSFEFKDRIPDEVFQKRAAWRGGFLERRLSGNNALLEPFGYSLKAKEGSMMDLYALYRGKEVLLDEINEFWPASVNASGDDFALVVGILNDGYRLVRKDGVENWDMGASLFNPPVFSGDHLLTIHWDGERSQAQVMKDDETIYAFASLFLTSSPVKGLWSWQGGWLLEVDGFLIQDGENLNERLGFEEILGWQTLNGKPFYYFRKGPRVGISHAGQILPVYYDDIPHYRCCEPAAFNAAGNEDMVWFYGLRDGMWYYVEIGAYGE